MSSCVYLPCEKSGACLIEKGDPRCRRGAKREVSQARAPIDELDVDVPAPLAAAGADVDDGEENDEWKTCSLCGKYRKMTREWFELFSVCADLADEHLDVTCDEPCDCDTPCDDFECPCTECVAR